MQGVSDERILLPYLTQVINKDISIAFAMEEFDRHKVSEKVRRAFYDTLNVDNWEELQREYGRWIEEKTIRDLHSQFKGFVST